MSSDRPFYKQSTLPDLLAKEKPAETPERIGPYRIEGLLTKGSMSLLYLGILPETGQTLAIKVLSPDFVTHPEAVERFLKEAQIIGITNHPNIVKLYGQGEWEDGLYIAMEFIRGISLSQFIIQQSFSLKRCIDIILQVAYALLHLHTHGVVHRDLKPENILITEDGEIKVIDFGIAQLHEEMKYGKTSTQVLGTPSYMSPEQKENPSAVTYSSDIYSLGVIAYELVLGKLSFGAINLALLPKGLQKIIAKALAVSASERYTDIVDFITDLSQYLKSGDLERDRPGSDQMKEMVEVLQKATSSLLPPNLPDWPELEIGLAKQKGIGQIGVYYDFFRFPENVFAIVLAEPINVGVEAAVYIASLRSIVKTLIQPKLSSPKETFNLLDFIGSLNQQVAEDTLKQPFAFAMLLLDPIREQLAYVSCGMGRLVHLSQGSTLPRFVAVQNLPLGLEMPGDFSETLDNWKIGDTLILHSLEAALPPGSPIKELETQFSLAISENALLSSERQADAILKRLTSTTHRTPKALVSLRRLS